MRIRILDLAERDLIEGFRYEAQEAGLGSYFLTNLFADIESLRLYAGIHEKPFKAYNRLLSRRFPFAVFYTLRKTSYQSMLSSIVARIRPGSESG